MKAVKSVADLNHKALSIGASVSMPGHRFNSTGLKLHTPRAAPPAAPAPPPPAPAPAPAVNHIHLDLGTAVSGALADHHAQLKDVVHKAIAAIPKPAPVAAHVAAPAPKSWRMQVVRDKAGLLDHVTLTPQF